MTSRTKKYHQVPLNTIKYQCYMRPETITFRVRVHGAILEYPSYRKSWQKSCFLVFICRVLHSTMGISISQKAQESKILSPTYFLVQKSVIGLLLRSWCLGYDFCHLEGAIISAKRCFVSTTCPAARESKDRDLWKNGLDCKVSWLSYELQAGLELQSRFELGFTEANSKHLYRLQGVCCSFWL